MKNFIIKIPNTNITFKITDGGEFEFVNPFELFFKDRLNFIMMYEKERIKEQNRSFSEKEINEFIYHKALKEHEKEIQKLLNIALPDGLISVLDLNSKKDQIKSLKGISLNQAEFKSLILKAYIHYGYKYSLYRAEHNHKGFDIKKKPTLAYKDKNGKIISTGDSVLTSGEMKQLIDHRKMTIAKFLDKEGKWHCFFHTLKSLKGQEFTYENGTPHIHYISNTFGKSRQEVLTQLKSEKYNLGSLPHIDYFTHRNPKK